MRHFFRRRHSLASLLFFLRHEVFAKLGGSPEKSNNMRYLSFAPFSYP